MPGSSFGGGEPTYVSPDVFVYKNGDEWKFNAIGSGYQGGLAALCANFGVEVDG